MVVEKNPFLQLTTQRRICGLEVVLDLGCRDRIPKLIHSWRSINLINKLRVYDETIKRAVALRVTNLLKISIAMHGASQFSKPALECLFVVAFELPEVFVMLVLGRTHHSVALSGLEFILFVDPGRRSFQFACPGLFSFGLSALSFCSLLALAATSQKVFLPSP